jgi:hypothetical protein
MMRFYFFVGWVSACTATSFNEGETGVGNPRAPIAAAPAPTPVFDSAFDPAALSASATPEHSHEAADQALRYTCPMHPEIVRDKPGTCPICGMKLVPKAPAHGEHH